jgi:integrase
MRLDPAAILPVSIEREELHGRRRTDDHNFRSTGVPSTIASRGTANKDGKLDASAVWRILRAAAKRARVQTKVSPHWLRHSCATRLVQREQNLNSVSHWL